MKVVIVPVGKVKLEESLNEILEKLGVDFKIERVDPNMNEISERIYSLSGEGFDVIFTVGGVGTGDDEIVPEATEMVIDRRIAGLEFFVLNEVVSSGDILTRIVAGIRKDTIIVNLPERNHHELIGKIVKLIEDSV